ncbi:MAG: hypothetical protein GX078_06840 [Clostridiales bacterium]|nr:hypothetical protein [Clostridiales bacterium]
MKKFKIKEYIKNYKFYEIEARFNRLDGEEQEEILKILEYLKRLKEQIRR